MNGIENETPNHLYSNDSGLAIVFVSDFQQSQTKTIIKYLMRYRSGAGIFSKLVVVWILAQLA